MDYYPGGDLYSYLEERGTLNKEEVKNGAARIVLILEDLHSRGLIHRDLKSENFLVDSEGRLVLCDFGNSTDRLRLKPRAYSLCGTQEFMAPEVINLEEEGYDFSFDWWSFGCLLYDMLVGSTPFHSMSQN